jgi:hypothetical protein
VVSDSAIGNAEHQGDNFGRDDSVVWQCIPMSEDFERLGKVAAHDGTSLNLAISACLNIPKFIFVAGQI